MIAETDRLILRRWTRDDVDRVFDVYSRWEIARWLGTKPRVMASVDEAAAAIDRWTALIESSDERHGVWAIEVRDTGTVAGSILFKPLPNSDGSPPSDIEVGWHLHPDSWGHGYATEAARAIVARGFAAGLDDVYAVVWPDNAASIAVCTRLGMEPLGQTDRWYGATVEAFRLSAGF